MQKPNKRQPLLGGALRLTLITMVAGMLLGAVHSITNPIIQQRRDEWAQASMAALLPAAEYRLVQQEMPQLPPDNHAAVTEAYFAVDDQGDKLGMVVFVTGYGYGSDGIQMVVALDAAGNLHGTAVGAHGETDGIGSKALDDAYLNQMQGVYAADVALGQTVDAISGATMSSRGVTQAIAAAGFAYQAYWEGGQGE